MRLQADRGQSLVELIIAIGIGALFVVGAIGALSVSLRLESQSSYGQPAIELAGDLVERLRTAANADWHPFVGLTYDDTTHYQAATSSSFYVISPGEETVVLNGIEYSRYFTIDQVARDIQNSIVPVGTSGSSIDASTLKITSVTEWTQYGQTTDVRIVHYLTRIRDRIWGQTDWSGGLGGDGPTTLNYNTQFTQQTNAVYTAAGELTIEDLNANLQSTAGNGIDATYRYAWNDVIGWIDFAHYGTVTVSPSATTTHYASSSVGQIALDCATSPNGNICGTLFGVYQNASGTLSNYAWNDSIGWISFNCASVNPPTGNCSDQPGGVDYRVQVNPVTSYFEGWAWNDVVGWISFNCDHSQPGDPFATNTCPPPRGSNGAGIDYAVKTGASTVSVATVDSMIFNTQVTGGVALNTLAWYGDQPPGTNVGIQIASGNNETDVELTDFVGPDGTSNTYYRPTGAGIPIKVNRTGGAHNNVQYIRYRVRLESNPARSSTPTVTDVMVNYSL